MPEPKVKMVTVEACTICDVAIGETQRNWGYVFTATDVSNDDDDDDEPRVKLIGQITEADLKGFVKARRVNRM